MTPPTAVDAPIPDDVLADALIGAANSGPFDTGDALPEEPAETPPDPEPTEPEAEPVTSDADDELDDEETPPSEPPAESANTQDPFAEALKTGKPLTYVVDGQPKETADIVEVEGRGAVIPPEALNRVRDRLQQADRLATQNKTLYTESQERVKAHERDVSEWERKVARLDAAGAVLLDMLENPQNLLALQDPQQREFLVRQMQVAAKEADFKTREAFEQRQQTTQTQTADAETRRTLLESQVKALTEGLPAEDVKEAMEFFGPMANVLYRPVTAEDIAQFPAHNLQLGQPIFDAPRIEAWAVSRKNLRAQMSESAQKRTDAAKHNARVQAAPKPKAPVKVAKSVPRNEDGTFAEKKKYDRDDFLRAAMRNEPTPGTSSDE